MQILNGRPLLPGRDQDAQHWDGRLLGSYIDDAALATPSRIALVEGLTRLTYRDMSGLVNTIAKGLMALGVVPGDVVSWQLPNWWEAVIVQHAILAAGAVSNPLMTILRERELRFMLENAKSTVLFIPEHFRGFDHSGLGAKLSAVLPDLRNLIIVRPSVDHAGALPLQRLTELGNASSFTPADLRLATDPAVLLYTSGTESTPKGAVHSHNTIGYENRSLIDLFNLHDSDVIFMPSPLPHITGICYGVHLSSMISSTVVLQDIWEPGYGLELIESERCSFTVGATPFLYTLAHHPDLARRDISSLRVFGCGGADVSPTLVRTATERLETCVVRLYGSTEFPTLSAGRCTDTLDQRAETDGRPIGHARARCIDEAGNDVTPGHTGELLVKGPELFLGYLDDAATANSMADDGWFRTGDFATIEKDGSIVIRGRRKDIIVRGGENISIKEIEDLILGNPMVQEVAIVAMPDPVMVERMCAYVVAKPGTLLTLELLNESLEVKGVMRQKHPERLELVDELPKTASGKIKKFELRKRIAKALQYHPAGPDQRS